MNSKYIKFIIFIIALLILGLFFSQELVFVKNGLLKITSPISAAILSPARSVKGFFVSLKSIKNLSKENVELKKQNSQLKSQLADTNEVIHENEALKKEIGFKASHSERELIPARVTNFSPSGFFQTIKIDKGSSDGVQKDKAVLSEGYLVGIVKDVGSDFSEINLITNNGSIVAVLLQESRGTGLLKGGLKGLIIEDVPLDSLVKKDEAVVTSGLGGTIPSGIIVGNVNEVISSESEIFKRVSVKSPVEFGQLEFVYVLK